MYEITQKQIQSFHEDGYLIIKSLFDKEEMGILMQTAKEDKIASEQAQVLDDGAGGKSNLTAWTIAGDDLYGMFARCHRVVDTAEALIGHEVYHYHSKLLLKEPYTGGAWAWHQDYGYWYNYGYLFPDMISCMIAIGPATMENGCLQVLKGSHKMGRIEHALTGDQAGANPERVELACNKFELVHCELEQGTALFFHSNLLHTSAQNKSPNPRWCQISCYTASYNISEQDPHHPGYHRPFVKVPDSAIKDTGKKGLNSKQAFMNKGVIIKKLS